MQLVEQKRLFEIRRILSAFHLIRYVCSILATKKFVIFSFPNHKPLNKTDPQFNNKRVYNALTKHLYILSQLSISYVL